MSGRTFASRGTTVRAAKQAYRASLVASARHHRCGPGVLHQAHCPRITRDDEPQQRRQESCRCRPGARHRSASCAQRGRGSTRSHSTQRAGPDRLFCEPCWLSRIGPFEADPRISDRRSIVHFVPIELPHCSALSLRGGIGMSDKGTRAPRERSRSRSRSRSRPRSRARSGSRTREPSPPRRHARRASTSPPSRGERARSRRADAPRRSPERRRSPQRRRSPPAEHESLPHRPSSRSPLGRRSERARSASPPARQLEAEERLAVREALR